MAGNGKIVSLASLADPDHVVVEGRVAEVFGSRFVLDDGTARRLVDIGPGGRAAAGIAVGDTVTVEGRFRDDDLSARRIAVNGDSAVELPKPGPAGLELSRPGPAGAELAPPPPGGPLHGPHGEQGRGPGFAPGPLGGPLPAERLDARDAPPPPAGLFGWFEDVVDVDAAKTALEEIGYKDVQVEEERRHDADFRATGNDGGLWLVKVDSDNDVIEREPYRPLPDEAAAKAAVEKLGLTWTGDFTPRRHHVEADARTADGRSLVVELNPDGSLRKERY